MKTGVTEINSIDLLDDEWIALNEDTYVRKSHKPKGWIFKNEAYGIDLVTIPELQIVHLECADLWELMRFGGRLKEELQANA